MLAVDGTRIAHNIDDLRVDRIRSRANLWIHGYVCVGIDSDSLDQTMNKRVID